MSKIRLELEEKRRKKREKISFVFLEGDLPRRYVRGKRKKKKKKKKKSGI